MRERVDLRAVVRFFAPVVRRLFAPVLRLADFAAVFRAVALLFFFAAVVRFPAVRVAVERFALERFVVERLAVERLALDLVDRRAVPRFVPAAAVAPPVSSAGHLPDMTRSAASETASAISDPSFVALATTELAAWLAVSAASIPASLIFLRAAGLALIAAAAAASPAASISLLIAAFASLSTVVSLDFDFDVDFDDPFRLLDFAIATSLPVSPIDTRTQQQFRCGGEKAEDLSGSDALKGTAGLAGDPLEHGQRPEVTAVRSAPMADEHPFPTSLLNHETSDHLLSLR